MGLGLGHGRLKTVDSIVLLAAQLYYIYPLGEMDLNTKLISKMELLLTKLVGEGLALLLVNTMLL